MQQPGNDPGPPAWETSTLEKSHVGSLFAGYSEHQLSAKFGTSSKKAEECFGQCIFSVYYSLALNEDNKRKYTKLQKLKIVIVSIQKIIWLQELQKCVQRIYGLDKEFLFLKYLYSSSAATAQGYSERLLCQDVQVQISLAI